MRGRPQSSRLGARRYEPAGPGTTNERQLRRGFRPKRRLRHATLLAVAVLLLAGLTALAVARLGVDRIAHALTSVNVLWLLAAVVLDGISLVMRAFSWQTILRAAADEVDVGLPSVIRATMIGVLGSAVAPARAGEPLRAWLIARRTSFPRRAFALVLGTVFSQTLLNLVALAALAIFVVVSAGLFRGHVLGIALALGVPLAIAGLIAASPGMIRRATAARWAPLRGAAAWLHREATQLRRGLRVFADRRHGPIAALFQLLAWGIQLLAVYAISLSLGLEGEADMAAAAAVLLAVNITAVVPVTPSNLGVFQAATIAVLAAYGVSAGHGLAFGVLLQAVEVATAALLGVPALVGEGLRWRDLTASPAGEEASPAGEESREPADSPMASDGWRRDLDPRPPGRGG
jgi:phosphatidylinositol alpha-mannosyltransferase